MPHIFHPISNESSKETKENELVNLRLMPMKESALPFQCFFELKCKSQVEKSLIQNTD